MPKPLDHSNVVRIAEHLLDENFKQLDIVEAKYGELGMNQVIRVFLACFVGRVVHDVLVKRPEAKLSKKDTLNFVQTNFAEVKGHMQDAVAAGFTGAMNKFSGKDLEYYCLVKPIGPALNKEPA